MILISTVQSSNKYKRIFYTLVEKTNVMPIANQTLVLSYIRKDLCGFSELSTSSESRRAGKIELGTYIALSVDTLSKI